MKRLSPVGVLLVLVAGTASADVEPTEPAGPEPKLLPARSLAPPEAPVSWSHKGQFQVSARLALGLRAIVPYEKADFCGTTDSSTTTGNAPVCTGRAPFSFDLELGYGVSRRIDTILEIRLGLETDFAASAIAMGGPRIFHLAPGARFFFSDARTSKLFTTAQLVLDFSGYEDGSGAKRGTDIGVRNMNGLWFDLERAYGFYGYVGETLTMSRWLRFELELGFGFSARFR